MRLRLALVVFAVMSVAAAAPAPAVINGQPADQQQTKWFASFGGDYSPCGGTVISKRWILTAAHCVTGIDNPRPPFRVHINPVKRSKGKPAFTVDRIIVHPDFVLNDQLPNDVAVMHVTKKLPSHRLPMNTDADAPVKGAKVHVYGFGKTKKSLNAPFSNRLMTGRLIVRSGPAEQRCANWKKSRYDRRLQVCANDPVKRIDACPGDSGGPLVGKVAGRRTLIGIVSNGDACNGTPERPGLFTRVSTYAGWVGQVRREGQIVAESGDCSWPDYWCSISPKAPAAITLRNVGSATGTWRFETAASDVTFSAMSGSLGKGESVTVQIATKSAKVACRVATLTGTNLMTTRYELRLNGQMDGC